MKTKIIALLCIFFLLLVSSASAGIFSGYSLSYLRSIFLGINDKIANSTNSDLLAGQDPSTYLDDTTINNCSVADSCSSILYLGEADKNCSVDGSCGLITYDSELAYINNCSVDGSCANILYLGDADKNCSVAGSCANIAYDTEIINNCSVSDSCAGIIYWTDAPTCSAGDFVTSDGSALSCDTPTGGGGGGTGDKWLDGGTYIYPNSTFASNVKVFGVLQADDGTNITAQITGSETAFTNFDKAVADDYNDENFSKSLSSRTNLTYFGIPLNQTINASIDSRVGAGDGNFTVTAGKIFLAFLDLAELDNSVAGFITTAVNTLVNYFTKTEINSMLTNINSTIDTKLNITDQRYNETNATLDYFNNTNILISGVFGSATAGASIKWTNGRIVNVTSVTLTGDIAGITTNLASGLQGGATTGTVTLLINQSFVNNSLIKPLITTAMDTNITAEKARTLNITTQFGGDVTGTFNAIAITKNYNDSNEIGAVKGTNSTHSDHSSISYDLVASSEVVADTEVVNDITLQTTKEATFTLKTNITTTGRIKMSNENVTGVQCIIFSNGGAVCG
jgi:hypothetical protein